MPQPSPINVRISKVKVEPLLICVYDSEMSNDSVPTDDIVEVRPQVVPWGTFLVILFPAVSGGEAVFIFTVVAASESCVAATRLMKSKFFIPGIFLF